MLCGPSGVGKSTLVSKLLGGLAAIVSRRVVTKYRGRFDFGSVAITLLRLLGGVGAVKCQ